ncbi:MAG TPA: hypothetical protein GX721_08870, partial [Firmicutes bacterium]|nr:hypothetical protein [Bacillota bacterium]
GIQLDKDAVRLIATGAQGAARDALGLLEQCAAYTGGKITYEHAVAALGVAGFRNVVEFCDAVIQGDLAGALTLVRELIDSGHDPAMFLRDVLEHFRNLLVLQACGFKPDLIDVPETSAANLKRQAEVIPGALILEAIDILSDAESEMKYSASPQLTSEVITIKLVYLSSPLARDSQTTTSQERLTAGPAKGSQATADPATGSQATADPAASAPSADYSRAGGPRAVGPTAGVPAKTSTQASLDQIQADWNRVMDALKPGIEKTLYCEDGIPVELNENELVISFHDDVRKELASERRRKKSIQDALEKVFGVRFAISFVLTQEPNNVEFHLEPGDDSFKEEKISSADRPLDTEYSQEITGDIKDENESCLENHEEELAENLRRTREAVREHPTVKTALSVFKGRVFKIDV